MKNKMIWWMSLAIVFVPLLVIPMGCKGNDPGKEINWQELLPFIGAILIALYEILVRVIPTSSKWFSIIEIVYKIISFLIPNRLKEKNPNVNRYGAPKFP